ncbi:hypothetical protein ES703_73361 [subsurface metagenome]
MKLFKRKKYTKKYLNNLVIKAGSLARLWHMELQRCQMTLDVKRAKRILNHIYRIGRVQNEAIVKRDSVA